MLSGIRNTTLTVYGKTPVWFGSARARGVFRCTRSSIYFPMSMISIGLETMRSALRTFTGGQKTQLMVRVSR